MYKFLMYFVFPVALFLMLISAEPLLDQIIEVHYLHFDERFQY